MTIYFYDRELNHQMYQNKDYLSQQNQFIRLLRMKTNFLSIKAGLVDTTSDQQVGYLHIDLRDTTNIVVGFADQSVKVCLHELFEVWSRNKKAKYHKILNFKIVNLEEFLGHCHDILTVKFDDQWQKTQLS